MSDELVQDMKLAREMLTAKTPECLGCGRWTHGVDRLCDDNTRAGLSCTMSLFLVGERAGKWRRPVSKEFWQSAEWQVAIDEWLSRGAPLLRWVKERRHGPRGA